MLDPTDGVSELTLISRIAHWVAGNRPLACGCWWPGLAKGASACYGSSGYKADIRRAVPDAPFRPKGVRDSFLNERPVHVGT